MNITVKIKDRDETFSLDEARDLIANIRQQIHALRVKCPTCRCMIIPGEECSCCAEPDITFPEDF